MDRGRIIDQISNNNARFLNDFEDKKTSKNICQPPGGKSSFSLAWGMTDQEPLKKNQIVNNNSEKAKEKDFSNIYNRNNNDNNYANNYNINKINNINNNFFSQNKNNMNSNSNFTNE